MRAWWTAALLLLAGRADPAAEDPARPGPNLTTDRHAAIR